MMADVVDEDELNTGARRSGLFFGLLMTTSKAGAAFGPLTYAFLGLAGFDAAAGAENTRTALLALAALLLAAPFREAGAVVLPLAFLHPDKPGLHALPAPHTGPGPGFTAQQL